MDEVKTRGSVFTPQVIAEKLVSYIDNSSPQSILEPSCGVGDILKYIHPKHKVTAIDINDTYIKESKRLGLKNIKYIHQDFIDYTSRQKYDYIVGNPPYVKIQNLTDSTISAMKAQYPDFIYGNTNLYIYFVLKCFDLLKKEGKLIMIIPNTFLYNKSLHKFKEHLYTHKLIEELIDFKDTQVFEDATTYTCILVLSTSPKSSYKYSTGLEQKPKVVSYKSVNLGSRSDLLKHFRPKIGLMTLCDSVYIIKEFKLINDHIYFSKDGVTYKIEKDACKNILKVSKNKVYKIIYPYVVVDDKVEIDTKFGKRFPRAYKYLSKYKDKLGKRDSGKGVEYEVWYQYGRSNGIKPYGNKTRVFMPTLVQNVKGSLIEKKVDLYYSGLWLEHDRKNKEIIDLLEKNDGRILMRSGNKSSGWHMISRGSFT
jgi:adenine-specific DNA-methyltransferase